MLCWQGALGNVNFRFLTSVVQRRTSKGGKINGHQKTLSGAVSQYVQLIAADHLGTCIYLVSCSAFWRATD